MKTVIEINKDFFDLLKSKDLTLLEDREFMIDYLNDNLLKELEDRGINFCKNTKCEVNNISVSFFLIKGSSVFSKIDVVFDLSHKLTNISVPNTKIDLTDYSHYKIINAYQIIKNWDIAEPIIVAFIKNFIVLKDKIYIVNKSIFSKSYLKI